VGRLLLLRVSLVLGRDGFLAVMVSHRHSLKMLHKIMRVYWNKDAKVYCMTVAVISKSGVGYKVVFRVFCASVMHC